MAIHIDEKNLKHGLLGLVLAIVEIIKDTLKLQALRRMDGGSLKAAEIERLGKALKELEAAVDEIKEEQGLSETIRSVREGLDRTIHDAVSQIPGNRPPQHCGGFLGRRSRR